MARPVWLTWQRGRDLTGAVAIATLLAFLGVLVVNAIVTAHDERIIANHAISDATSIAASSQAKIDAQSQQIEDLKHQLDHSSLSRNRQIGRLQDSLVVLARQLRKHHLVPAVVVHRTTRIVRPRHGHAKAKRQHSSPSRPVVSPQPKPLVSLPPLPGNGKHKGQRKHPKP